MSCPECDLNYRLAVICSFVCVCSEAPEIGENGEQLKQLCVNKGLSSLNAAGKLPGVLPEVAYAMVTDPPLPLLKIDKSNSRIKPVRNHWERIKTVKDILGKKQTERLGNGKFRIPDITLLNDPTQLPTTNITNGNMQAIVEIKFEGDKWGKGQKEAYKEIAGDKPFIKMGDPPDTSAEDFCKCEGKRQRRYAEAIQPALAWDQQRQHAQQPTPAPAPQPAESSSTFWNVLGLVGTGVALVWLVGNDVTGVGAADDVAIPPTAAAFAAFAAALGLSSTASAQETLHDSFPDDVYP